MYTVLMQVKVGCEVLYHTVSYLWFMQCPASLFWLVSAQPAREPSGAESAFLSAACTAGRWLASSPSLPGPA